MANIVDFSRMMILNNFRSHQTQFPNLWSHRDDQEPDEKKIIASEFVAEFPTLDQTDDHLQAEKTQRNRDDETPRDIGPRKPVMDQQPRVKIRVATGKLKANGPYETDDEEYHRL